MPASQQEFLRYFTQTPRHERILPPPNQSYDRLDDFLITPHNFQKQNLYEKIVSNGNRRYDLGEVVARLENPTLNRDTNVDCISCHLAAIELYEELKGPKVEMAKPSYDFASPEGITNHIQVGYRGKNIERIYLVGHLSYFKSATLFSQRTANESAVAADRVNILLDLENPSPIKCNSWKFRTCSYQDGASTDACAREHCNN